MQGAQRLRRGWPWKFVLRSAWSSRERDTAGRELRGEPVVQAGGAKLVTCACNVIEEPPKLVRAALLEAEAIESVQRNLPAAKFAKHNKTK